MDERGDGRRAGCRVMIVTQHFTPEVTAGRFRVEAFATALARRGHEVEVICPVPNHPRGVVAEGYRGRPIVRRDVDGARVKYLRSAVAPRKTVRSRLSYYGSFALASSVVGAASRRPDAIVASSPPLPVAAVGAMLAARHRRPWLLDVRDLWPRAAVDLGELRDGRALHAAERLERGVYARADHIVTTNDAFRDWIRERAPADTEIDVVPNGTTEEWLAVGGETVSRAQVGLPEERFVWAYAGNIGLAHGLEVAADAAGILGDGYTLLVIGDGPRRMELVQRAASLPQPSFDLRGLMPPAAAARHLRAADAVLISERQEATVSAKLYDVCAVGRPAIAACEGEMRRLVESEGIALAVPHGDHAALAAAVRRLREDERLRRDLAGRAREFARRHLRSKQAVRFADLVERVAAGGRRS